MAASSATRSNDVFVGFGARDGVSGNYGGTMASSEADSLYYGLHRELMDAGCFEPAPWSEIGSMIFVGSDAKNSPEPRRPDTLIITR